MKTPTGGGEARRKLGRFCEAFPLDARCRSLSSSSLDSYRRVLERVREFAEAKGTASTTVLSSVLPPSLERPTAAYPSSDVPENSAVQTSALRWVGRRAAQGPLPAPTAPRFS